MTEEFAYLDNESVSDSANPLRKIIEDDGEEYLSLKSLNEIEEGDR